MSTKAHCMRVLPAGFVAAGISAFLWGITFTSCADDKHSYVDNVGNGMSTPTMTTVNVNTYISDSGFTRYHIAAPKWLMYEEAADPFWRFPDGLDLEQYDLRMRVSATMTCDSATYLSQKRIWRLDGNVVMVNTLRDSFLTQQVFWDQNRRQVYSDSFIHIVRTNRIIEGYGFTSNENITEYTVKNPTAIIPISRRGSGSQDGGDVGQSDNAPADTTPAPARRATYQRRSASTPGDVNEPEEPQPANPSHATRSGLHKAADNKAATNVKPRPTTR